jgi:hypothetical protein
MSIIIMKLLNGDPTQVPRMGRQDRVNRSTKVWASHRFFRAGSNARHRLCSGGTTGAAVVQLIRATA